MGSGIAAQLANAGVPVVLLDVVPDGAARALERLRRARPPAFMDADGASLVTAGNVGEHLGLIADADWIAEAVVERLEIKREIYAAIEGVRRPGALVSSNTSTIPLALLTEGMSEAMARDFCITHFFNPVRYMRLLELVAGPRTRPEVIRRLAEFCDVALGKGVVHCRDTPGFLANRLGVFALQVGMVEALACGLGVEEADAIMGRPMGIPKTGVFGLYDLIGLDLMLDVARSLAANLPPHDAFHQVAEGIPAVHALVARGATGNKGGGGFYRTVAENGDSRRQALDLASGEYRDLERPVLAAAVRGEREGLRALAESPGVHGRFARRVLARTLAYAASLVPEVADSVLPIDEAMKLGYNWTRGPFEMLDALGAGWLRERLAEEDVAAPEFLHAAGARPFYRAGAAGTEYLDADARYRPLARAPGVVRLGDLTATRRPLAANDAASLWDVGDGFACIEFHTKANALTPASMALLGESVAIAERDYRALLVCSDAQHFSVGFNIALVLEHARRGRFDLIDRALSEFHAACLAVKYARVPVVGAPAGMSLGGGCEVLLHCAALEVHANTVIGLVETLVGLVPSGGGCKELLCRWQRGAGSDEERVRAALEVFDQIGAARTASSPAEGRAMRYLRESDGFQMNRDRLLAAARTRAAGLAAEHRAPEPPALVALGAAGRDAMAARLDELERRGIATAHDRVVARHLAHVLCGGDAPAGTPVSEQDLCDLEREAFVELARTKATQARIEHMLARGTPLRN